MKNSIQIIEGQKLKNVWWFNSQLFTSSAGRRPWRKNGGYLSSLVDS